MDEGIQVAIDCSGHPTGLQTALDMAHESYYVFSVPHGPVQWGKIHWLRSITIQPYHWRGGSQPASLQRAADLLGEGKLVTSAIVTHVLPYTRYDEGQQLLIDRAAIKVVYSGWE